jgi:hypothetical protein
MQRHQVGSAAEIWVHCPLLGPNGEGLFRDVGLESTPARNTEENSHAHQIRPRVLQVELRWSVYATDSVIADSNIESRYTIKLSETTSQQKRRLRRCLLLCRPMMPRMERRAWSPALSHRTPESKSCRLIILDFVHSRSIFWYGRSIFCDRQCCRCCFSCYPSMRKVGRVHRHCKGGQGQSVANIAPDGSSYRSVRGHRNRRCRNACNAVSQYDTNRSFGMRRRSGEDTEEARSMK